MRDILVIVGILLLLGCNSSDPTPEEPIPIESPSVPLESPTGTSGPLSEPAPDPERESPDEMVVELSELQTQHQGEGFNPEFYEQRKRELREGPWRPYKLGPSPR